MDLEILIIPFVIIFLFILIILCLLKLNIFFNGYNFLSKKINADKVTYIANISFYKFYYNKNERLLGFIIDRLIMVFLLLLAIIAIVGIILNKTLNYGFLNYYYGDTEEYSFLNNFINIIIILSIIYCGSHMYWLINEKEEEDKLYESENTLREFIKNNIDYKYLYYYTSRPTANNSESDDNSVLNTYISESEAAGTINRLLKGTENPIYLFQLCFTYHMMNDKPNSKLTYITKDIKKRLKEINDIDKKNDDERKEAIIKKLNDIDIIANYNNSNETALPQLYKLINDFKNGLNDDNKIKLKTSIENITVNLINKESNDDKAKKILGIYETAKTSFRNPIVFFKNMYDKYYMYYIISIFLTNIFIIYAILIFIYILIRLSSKGSFESIYMYKLIFKRIIFYILLLYFLVTCPIIIFSYN
jgi:hypothetical protein